MSGGGVGDSPSRQQECSCLAQGQSLDKALWHDLGQATKCVILGVLLQNVIYHYNIAMSYTHVKCSSRHNSQYRMSHSTCEMQ